MPPVEPEGQLFEKYRHRLKTTRCLCFFASSVPPAVAGLRRFKILKSTGDLKQGPKIIPGRWINDSGTEGDPDIYWGAVISPPRVPYKCRISAGLVTIRAQSLYKRGCLQLTGQC